MKKSEVSWRNYGKFFSFLVVVFLSVFQVVANNPQMSITLPIYRYQSMPEAVDDVVPEMIIHGNTIHVVWLENKYGVENPFTIAGRSTLEKHGKRQSLLPNLKIMSIPVNLKPENWQ